MPSVRALAACGALAAATTVAAGGLPPTSLVSLPQIAEPEVTGPIELELADGIVRGSVTSIGVNRFLGVPFGAPPVGDLRWQPPQPVANWSGVRDAQSYSKSCPQSENAFDDVSGISEDCLYLNLWVPAGPPPPADEGYAAMIFFYGGSWTTGSAMFPLYSGEALTASNNATVVIAVNYRLAAFGFMASDFLRGSDNSTGNFGLQDQRLAMQWLHANAKFLNVDTDRIMIFGESAGAGSVSAHLVAHRSRGLFTRAAMESGPFADWTSDSLIDSAERFALFTNHTGCDVLAPGATPEQIAATQKCLRSKNMTEILDASRHLPGKGLTDWQPTVDGVEFTDFVQLLAAKGDIANVPVLFGTNQNEGTQFCSLHYDANESALDAYIDYEFSSSNVTGATDWIKAAYPVADFKKHSYATAAWWAGSEMVGDAEMTCAARRTARFLNIHRGSDPAAAYVYYYTHELAAVPIIELASKEPFGVFHGSELPLVFGQQELLLLPEEKEMSKMVRHYWTNFAYSGDPNTPRPGTESASSATALPNWPAHVMETNLTLNLAIDPTPIANLKGDRCDMWDRIGPIHPP